MQIRQLSITINANFMVLNILALPLAFQFTSPGPIIFQLGPLAIRWYGLLIASAVLIGVSLSQYLAQKRRVNPDLLGDLAIWLVLGAIPCARILLRGFRVAAIRPETRGYYCDLERRNCHSRGDFGRHDRSFNFCENL